MISQVFSCLFLFSPMNAEVTDDPCNKKTSSLTKSVLKFAIYGLKPLVAKIKSLSILEMSIFDNGLIKYRKHNMLYLDYKMK